MGPGQRGAIVMAVQLAVQLHLHLQYNRSCTAVQLAHCYISIAVQLAIIFASYWHSSVVMAVQLAVQLAVYQVASTLHPGTAEMARRTDEIARKSPNSLMVAVWQLFMAFTRGIRRRIPPRYAGKLVQWQYNGSTMAVMAV